MNKVLFKNKVAIVTGSSQGIGKEIARQLALNGAKVVLNGRNVRKLVQAYQEFKELGFDVISVPGDISKLIDCKNIIDTCITEFGSLDFLINNAGIAIEGEIEFTNPDVFKNAFDVNVLGQIYISQLAIPHLKKTKGSIVFSGSIAGIFGLPNFSAYSSTKMALGSIAESLRAELSIYDIHVGIVYIGFTENDPNKTFVNTKGAREQIPARNGFNKLSTIKVAKAFVRILRKRKFMITLSLLGHILTFTKRFFMSLFSLILNLAYKNSKKKKTN